MLLFVRNHVDGVILPAVRDAAGARDAASLDSALVKLAERLKAYAVIVKWTKSFFSYLDSFHTKRHGLPSLHDSFWAFIRQRLDSAATERQILDALAAAGTQNDIRGNPCRLCLAECRLLLVEALAYSVDLDEAPVPPKHALVELIRTARQARGADDAGLADLRFGGAGGLLALGKQTAGPAETYTELVRAAHATQRRQRFAAMPRAATEGLYTRDGEREPTADPAALRAVARHRPRQLLLLGAMVSRGADSASPLVGAPIVLSADLASKIREQLHQLPGVCPRAGSKSEPVAGEEFAWHPWAAAGGAAGGAAAAAAAQGSGKRKREAEESEEDQEEEEEEEDSDGSLSDGFEYESD